MSITFKQLKSEIDGELEWLALDKDANILTSAKDLIDVKRVLYFRGKWQAIAPPVCTANWLVDDWIKLIDACEGWKA